MAPFARPSSDLPWFPPQIASRGLQEISTPTSIPSHSPPPTTPQLQQSPSPPPPSRITPTLLYVIVILAVVFFVSGLLHLLIRFLLKQRSRANSSENNARGDISDSEAIQRQLQQLFHLHDSGLDQAFIDALPIFLYKELVGAKEPFDCAVCLCEFSEDDKLRLLPVCSHAFHLDCIDTWLLSNSTCPLCRGTLFVPGMAVENPIYQLEDTIDEGGMCRDLEEGEENEKMVFPVRLGKFRSIRGSEKGAREDLCSANGGVNVSNLRRGEGESSGSCSSLDRRCYSMGSYQYVVGESILQVALSTGGDRRGNERRGVAGGGGGGGIHEGMMEGRRLCVGGRGESFSVSKIWQWSDKNGRGPISSSDVASFDGGLGFQWRGGNRGGSSSMCGIIHDP